MAPARLRGAWLLGALVFVTLAAYHPAWHGGILWDDDHHITAAALQPVSGLWRIWFDVGATQQYYPLVHSAFWALHRVAGDQTTAYHLVTIVLHAISAFLIVCLLRRLGIPGALFAGALFAIHPVHVESVAWITELKNTLSGTLGLGAALAWVRFDDAGASRAPDAPRRSIARRHVAYIVCVALFVLALMAKTVTAMLPACLIIVAWWRRGRVGWRRDIRPLLPHFVLGAGAGLLTAWVERTIIRAQGAEYELSLVERALVAGRAIWFYLSTLAWPHPLIFIYPRWEVSDRDWAQYAYPLAAVALAAALWAIRRRSRGPFAALAIFCTLLFPALGFLNVYPFRFSFVADHFAYLASVPVFAFVGAAAASLATRRTIAHRAVPAAAALLLVLLAVMTWRQSRDYTDATTLYARTLARNPRAWIAAVNLGVIELERDPAAAAGHFRHALAVKPDIAEAHSDLGNALQRMGRPEEAVAEYREAVRLDPELAEAHNNLASALVRLRQPEAAAREGARAVELTPDNADAQFNLAVALHALGRPDALNHFAAAVRLRPDLAEAHNFLGIILQGMGRDEDALAEYAETVRLRPDHAGARFNLANLLQARGQFASAIVHYQALLARTPGDAAAHNNLGGALEASGRVREAAVEYQRAADLDPGLSVARENLRRLAR